jgi:hypothetical protein
VNRSQEKIKTISMAIIAIVSALALIGLVTVIILTLFPSAEATTDLLTSAGITVL